MELLKEFKNSSRVKETIKYLRCYKDEITIMEVCGSHTMSILKSGLKDILPPNIKLISGPGCPVCVTDSKFIDEAIELSKLDNVIITTFGDLMKIPGSFSTLQKEKALGRDIRTVYSPLDSLNIAEENKDKEVIFLAVGFETTAPIVALTVFNAKNKNLKNFTILNSLKTMPMAMKNLVLDKELSIDGFICPGHVATIIGTKEFDNIAKEYNLAMVIAGFEVIDIVIAIQRLIEMKEKKENRTENIYKRLVKEEGNSKALNILREVFTSDKSKWRGLGSIEDTGLKLREKYSCFDALSKFKIRIESKENNNGCQCGEILRGIINPEECKLFGKVCTPISPKGPCMVSDEGTCANYYKYR